MFPIICGAVCGHTGRGINWKPLKEGFITAATPPGKDISMTRKPPGPVQNGKAAGLPAPMLEGLCAGKGVARLPGVVLAQETGHNQQQQLSVKDSGGCGDVELIS